MAPFSRRGLLAALSAAAAVFSALIAGRRAALAQASGPTGQVSVTALARAKPGQEDELGRRMMALVGPTRREEGCLNYDLHRSNSDPALWVLYENWRSQAHRDAHMRSPHVLAFFQRADEVLTQVDSHVMTMASTPAPAETLRPHHVAIGVPDLQASIAWYRDMLGFEVAERFRVDTIGFSSALVQRGGFRVEIFQFDDGRPVPASRSDPVGDLRAGGLSHFAFAVPELRAFVADLERRGVRIVVPVTEFVAGLPVAFIADNSGNLIELVPESWN